MDEAFPLPSFLRAQQLRSTSAGQFPCHVWLGCVPASQRPSGSARKQVRRLPCPGGRHKDDMAVREMHGM
jgi:hypothetical protein